MAAKSKNAWKLGDKPRIYVTENGEAYVKADEVVASKKFQEQIKEIANLRVNQQTAKARRRRHYQE